MQRTTAENGPPEFLKGYLGEGINDLVDLYHQNPNAPGYFPGSTVAPQSSATQQAIAALAARGAGGSPVTAAAQGAVTDTASGKYLDPTSNPYFTAALSASHQPYVDQFMGEVLPGITSAFEGSGRTGSGLHQAAVDRAVTGLNRTISDSDAKVGAGAYDAERARMLQAAGLAPQTAATDYADINALGMAGEGTDAYKQAQINEEIARYNYGNTAQQDYINRYLASLNAGYPGGTTTGVGTATGTQPGGSTMGSIFGGAGLALQALPALVSLFSDERLKEDIEPVGSLNDGQTVYRYRYKGDPTPHIGLMAQEVAQTHPEAVHVDPGSGFLKVNYAAATKDAARGLF